MFHIKYNIIFIHMYEMLIRPNKVGLIKELSSQSAEVYNWQLYHVHDKIDSRKPRQLQTVPYVIGRNKKYMYIITSRLIMKFNDKQM